MLPFALMQSQTGPHLLMLDLHFSQILGVCVL